MKFDYIIGNPPYQSPTSNAGKGSKKLYFNLTKKFCGLFKEQMIFLTPKQILVNTSMNTAFDCIQNKIQSIKNREHYFTVNSPIIEFLLSHNPKGLVYNNKSIEHLYEAYSENAKEFYPFYSKISPRFTKHKKLKIRPSHYPFGYKASHYSKEPKEGYVEVKHQKQKGTHKVFIDPDKITPESSIKKIIVPYASDYFEPYVSNELLTEFFGIITVNDYPEEMFDSILSYLKTDFIKYYITEYSKMTGSNYYNALWQLPEVPFDRTWNTKKLEDYFHLSM